MEMLYITLVIIIIIFLIITIISIKLINNVARPFRYEYKKTYEIEIEKGYIIEDEYNKLNKEEVIINNNDYLLNGTFIYSDSNQKMDRFVIITHGYSYTRYGSVKYAKIFLDLGYHCLIYDLRHHGLNKDTYTSMGYHEQYDLLKVIEYVQNRYGEDVKIGLHGESLGAATSLLVLNLTNNIEFVVADCSYSNLMDLLKYQLIRQYKLPSIFLSIANYYNMFFYKYDYQTIRPIDVIKKTDVPILFVHGEKDDFTPPSMSFEMYNLNYNNKLLIVENAKHAVSYVVNPNLYIETINNFVNNIKKTPYN